VGLPPRAEGGVPSIVPNVPVFGFDTVTALLVGRVASQGRSFATLLERGHELDARMMMRSALEHLTLLAWLAIDPLELPVAVQSSRRWRARNRDENVQWWLADQIR
jgi:hypothetical protein